MNPGFSRQIVYPTLFRLRGEQVQQQLADLAASQWHNAAGVQMRQFAALRDLLTRIQNTDSPYARKLAALEFPAAQVDDRDALARLPLMEKSDLLEHQAWLRSGSRDLPRHDVRMSGGSTGDPCLVLADRRTSARSLAARVLCQGWFGIELGDRQIRCWGRTLARARRRNRLKDIVLNRIRLDSLALEDASIAATLRRIERFGAEFIYGYTSLIQLLADQTTSADIARVFGGLKAVVATSETLLPAQRDELTRHFEAPIALEYGCSEVDIISFSCPEGRQHVIAENILAEVVRFGDEPEGMGQVVVTDLNNTLMPVVRYRVGDLVPLEAPSCSCGRGWPCLGQIVGRSQGQYILLPARGRVHSQFVVYLIEDLMAAGRIHGRFQIIQESPDRLRLLFSRQGPDDPTAAELASHFARECRDVLGPEMDWQIEFVAPADFETGRTNKFQHFQGLGED